MNKKQAIYKYCIPKFYENGMESVTMKEIFSNTKTTTGSFYNKFSSKDDILFAFFLRLLNSFDVIIKKEFNEIGYIEYIYLENLLIRYLVIKDENFAKMLLEFITNYYNKRKLIKRRYNMYLDTCSDIVIKRENWRWQTNLYSLLIPIAEYKLFSKTFQENYDKLNTEGLGVDGFLEEIIFESVILLRNDKVKEEEIKIKFIKMTDNNNIIEVLKKEIYGE